MLGTFLMRWYVQILYICCTSNHKYGKDNPQTVECSKWLDVITTSAVQRAKMLRSNEKQKLKIMADIGNMKPIKIGVKGKEKIATIASSMEGNTVKGN